MPRQVNPRAPKVRFVRSGTIMFKANGEYRKPEHGEYYLSGERENLKVYWAASNLAFKYWIAVPVEEQNHEPARR